MKKLFAACLLLLLTSCLEVENYGDYWDKGSIDPSLSGKWLKISETDEVTPTGQSFIFTPKDGSYQVQTFSHGKPADDDGPIYPVRTITVGPYKFLAKGPDQGSMVRYTVEGNAVVFYELNSKKAWAFFQKNYPGQEEFYKGDPDDSPEEMDESDDPMKLDTLNSQAAKMISALPDNESIWEPDTLIKRPK
jgi:hypothetical protein